MPVLACNSSAALLSVVYVVKITFGKAPIPIATTFLTFTLINYSGITTDKSSYFSTLTDTE